MINFRFTCAVWGDAFTDTFLNVCLPSVLSEGNLKFIASHSDCRFHIYTLPSDVDSLNDAPTIRQLRALMPVEIVAATGLTETHKNQSYQIMAAAHSDFVKRFNNDGSAMVFISPDTIWGDGSFRRLFDIAQSGKRLVMLGSVRLNKESFLVDLQRYMKGRVLQPIGNRMLVRLAMKHLHAETKSLTWNSGILNTWPSLLFWRVRGEGLLLRAFHLHPLMIRPASNIIPVGQTIDSHYVEDACPNPDDVCIVLDSDEMVCFELSTKDNRAEVITDKKIGADGIAKWADGNTSFRHRQFIQLRIAFHSDKRGKEWKVSEVMSDGIVSEILTLLEAASDYPQA